MSGPRQSTATITLGGGCFWCLDAMFRMLKGVTEVTSGYAGGQTIDPTYQQVSSGETGHAEVVQVTFDPAVLPLVDVLDFFFAMHDPTTKDRQGPDVGTQYRSIVLYDSPEQEREAKAAIQRAQAN
ncbi:MAG TPA: peptide-methionine (S)-S-oxide reductase MsrA, partial [Patescibacteria group bacterium]